MIRDLERLDVTPFPKPVKRVKDAKRLRAKQHRRTDEEMAAMLAAGVKCACGCGKPLTTRDGTRLTGHRSYAEHTPATCIVCGVVFLAKPSEAARGRKYCSRACWLVSPPKKTPEGKARFIEKMQARIGENNPNFKHGRRRGEHFSGWSAKEKGEPSCRVCGSAAKELHHAVPRSVCPSAAKRDLRNGLPLCHRCHRRWHLRTAPIYRDVFTADEWAYISSLELTGRQIAGWLDEHYPMRPKEVAA